MRLNRKRIKHTILIINTLNYINYEKNNLYPYHALYRNPNPAGTRCLDCSRFQYTLRFSLGHNGY